MVGFASRPLFRRLGNLLCRALLGLVSCGIVGNCWSPKGHGLLHLRINSHHKLKTNYYYISINEDAYGNQVSRSRSMFVILLFFYYIEEPWQATVDIPPCRHKCISISDLAFDLWYAMHRYSFLKFCIYVFIVPRYWNVESIWITRTHASTDPTAIIKDLLLIFTLLKKKKKHCSRVYTHYI